MKVKELIEFLSAFEDQDAIVNVIEHLNCGGNYYLQGGSASVVVLSEKCMEYSPQFSNYPPTLLLGVYEG